MDSERRAFLNDAVEKRNVDERKSATPRPLRFSWPAKVLGIHGFWIHLVLILGYSIISVLIIKSKVFCQCVGDWLPPNAIYNLTVRHSQKSRNLYAFSQYAGPPAPNIDEAWHKLLSPIDIRVTKEELERNNRTSVELPEGGYLAWLGVFHEVHCVKLLRQWKYKEHYYPNITEKQRFDLESHTDHCLDRILALFTCHPDTASLVTFYWDKTHAPTVDGTKTLHSCVDWDAMIESTRSRMVSNAEVAALRNPLLEDLL